MDLRRLTHVLALADELHFARAAARVHLSQPAFSRSIQAVEAELGLRLFERGDADVRPTPAGQFVIEGARKLLFDARCLQRDIDLYRDVELGDTAFGVGPFPAVTLMPRVLPELRQRHPKVGLRVVESNWKQLLERLRAESIEFFVSDTNDLPREAALTIRLLPPQQVEFYARAGHPLAGNRCAFAQVWQFGLASATPPAMMQAALAAALGQSPSAAVPALECDNFAILRTVALSTETVLACTRALVVADVDAGTLVRLEVKDAPELIVRPGIVSLTGRTPSPMARCAMECIERVANSLWESAAGQG
ncbi:MULTISPECIES: LysR family transcriptional regulator [Cupriavidus]|uniref:LysR family transcriptional regulator n=1 Tax=Cupriavidus sp. DF5525 TaxID=3160989 RepID=UPI0032DF9434